MATPNRNEEWCADFDAWVGQTAGAVVVYQYINGDLNSDVVNGDGDRAGFSVVEVGSNEYRADAPGVTAYLSATCHRVPCRPRVSRSHDSPMTRTSTDNSTAHLIRNYIPVSCCEGSENWAIVTKLATLCILESGLRW